MAEMSVSKLPNKPLIILEGYSTDDVVKYVGKSGEVMDGEIEAIIPMHIKGKLDYQFIFVHPRTGSRRQYLYSDIRIDSLISRKENHDRLQDSDRFYYLLCR